MRLFPKLEHITALASFLFLFGCRAEPKSFEDCALLAIGETNRSKAELQMIHDACRAKFPAPAETLPPQAVRNLEVKGDRSVDGVVRATLYNGTGWTITGLEVQIGLDQWETLAAGSTDYKAEGKLYEIDGLRIAPRTTGPFSVTTILDDDRNLGVFCVVTSATGVAGGPR